MSRRDPLRIGDYLAHIAQAIANIKEFTSGMDFPGYLADRKTQDAVIRNFEIIGEASNKIDTLHPQFSAAHPDVQWKVAYDMRNALAHGYFKVDHQVVWNTIREDLPQLESAIERARLSAPK